MQPLPEIYKNRSLLLRRVLEIGLSPSTYRQYTRQMVGKTEEEKEQMALEAIKDIERKALENGWQKKD